jgi:hypothetical protein
LRSGTTPLVGRDEEVELLTRRWQRAKSGEGRVVLISGEPGIGKSRLTVRCPSTSRPNRISACAISVRRTTRTARFIPSSRSLNVPPGLPATVFEDAHWIDPTSRELLDLAVDWVRRLPVLLAITFRPEFQPLWIGRSLFVEE